MSHYNFTTTNSNAKKYPTETVLLLVAGGSLGAYECGVFKSLAKHNIWFDIVAGTSIGAVNATIIVDSIRKKNNNLQHNNNNNKNREGNNNDNEGNSRRHKMLLETAKRLEDFWLASADNITPKFLPFKIRSYISAANTFTLGHPNALIPIWFYPGGPLLNNGFTLPYLPIIGSQVTFTKALVQCIYNSSQVLVLLQRGVLF